MKLSRITPSVILSTITAILLTAPLTTQAIELVEKVGDFQIARVTSSKVCFAVLNTQSTKGADVTFATYKTKSGDRWQVAGFVKDEEITIKGDLLSIRFDDEHLMARGVEFSKGDFALPFTEDSDLEIFDKQVSEKEKMELRFRKLEDGIVVPLPELRKAKDAIDTCLANIE